MRNLWVLSAALLITARAVNCAMTQPVSTTPSGTTISVTTQESTTTGKATAQGTTTEEGKTTGSVTTQESTTTEEGSANGKPTTPAAPGLCSSSACQNGGTCTDKEGGFECECSDSWTGDTCSIPEHCSPSPCENEGICTNKDGGFECECSGSWTGDTCSIPVCTQVEEKLELKASIDCSNSSQNKSIVFIKTPVGQSATANVTCNSTCPLGATPVASARCIIEAGTSEPKFDTPTLVDCSKGLDELEVAEQIDTLVTVTSDVEAIDKDDVHDAVEVLGNVSKSDHITTEMLDSALTVTNNLLLATDEDAQSAVQNSSDAILTSLDTTAEKVTLDATGLYTQEQSNIALGIVQVPASSRAASSGTYYYGTSENIAVDANFANSNFNIGVKQPSQAYISASVAAGERVWFEVFTTEKERSLFNVTSVIVTTVYSVSSKSFEMRFLMANESENLQGVDQNGDIKEKEDGKNRITKYRCEKWDGNEKVWNEASGCKYTGGEGYATCTCDSGSGEYTMLRTVTVETVDDGLSDGAIAGIVVGCVVGVALIIGLVYYFAVYNKKKNKVKKVQPAKSDQDIPMSGHDNAGGNPYD